MKFKCNFDKNGKPYEWEKYTRNIFNKYFIHHLVLTNIENDRVLSKEFSKYLKKYKNIACIDSYCKKIKWLKSFKETKYTLGYVEEKDFEKYRKIGFHIVGYDDEPYNRLIIIRKNY